MGRGIWPKKSRRGRASCTPRGHPCLTICAAATSADSADQTVGGRRRRAHHSGAEQIAAALSGGAIGLAGDTGDRRAAAAQPAISNVIEFPRDEWSAPWRPAPYVSAARLVAQLRAAEYDLVLDLQGQFRSARVRASERRAGADRLRPAARGNVAGVAAKIPGGDAQARLAGRARGQLARLHRSHPGADARCPCRSIAISASGRCSASTTAPRISRFRFRRKRAPAIDALLDYYEIAKAKLSVMAPGTIWETKQWRRDGFRRSGAAFPAERLCGDAGRRRRANARSATKSRARARRHQSRRRNDTERACSADSPRGDLRDQQFRPDASRRRARPAGRERFRPDRSGLGRPLSARRRGAARRPALLAVLSARAQPLHRTATPAWTMCRPPR